MIIASNFKTNYTRGSAKAFIQAIQAFIANTKSEQQVRIFAPFTALDRFDEVATLKVGAQNFYPVQNGSFTGEIGFEQLEEFGIQTVLIGHSERRHILKESQNLSAQKYDFAKARESEIIYCIGEPAEIRVQGIDAVMSYLWEQFEGIDISYDKLIIAYEPVWAIGTGLTASLEDIEEVLTRLRDKLCAPLLYGGSVKVENIETILHVNACDGVLVGTASWNENAFCEMIRIADNVKK
ncbi:triose-phosphate isomerase [Sulfurospirillum halorespirans]|uniref:Triosephosphate isomerase n=1 Tax=Sulfurospirillum halorespirans DSM 13726 TaxID=1193502 RepID=A0A1D7TH60_9BACT|nr:triose-phosphate isomerase [Sulfurospirillum halorespirans]AOO64362.1 triosephosphate isomerase [Sulfurospirillum halorespirans DSM 13726]